MATAADRMKAMRERRKQLGYREIRLRTSDVRLASVRRRLAEQVARLTPQSESDALLWIEAVTELPAMSRGDVVTVAASGRPNIALAFATGLADR
jgi:hypothetical protein